MFNSSETTNKVMTDTTTVTRARKSGMVPVGTVAERLGVSVAALARLRANDYDLGNIPVRNGRGGGYTTADARAAVALARGILKERAREAKKGGGKGRVAKNAP